MMSNINGATKYTIPHEFLTPRTLVAVWLDLSQVEASGAASHQKAAILETIASEYERQTGRGIAGGIVQWLRDDGDRWLDGSPVACPQCDAGIGTLQGIKQTLVAKWGTQDD